MNLTSYNNLLQGIQHDDPRLYELLKQLGAQVIKHQLTLFPPEDVGLAEDAPDLQLPVLASFTYEIFTDNILLSWTLASGAAERFEIRSGDSWEIGNIVIQTDTSSARINPLAEGSHRYWIKAIAENGSYSAALFVDIIVSVIGSISVTAQVIDNNVLLSWTIPTFVFRINFFIVRKNGIEIGRTRSTFSAIFENIAGTYEYSVQAVDIYGNLSAEAFVIALVTQPPDYELRADFLSSLDGIKTNVTLTEGPRLLCNTRVETWEQHFNDRGWLTIQNQIAAGFPLYVHPSVEIGSYREIIDYELVISNTVITISYNTVPIYGLGVEVQCEIETSLDNITYTPPVVATTLFVASLRYARVTFTFTALN